MGSEQSLGGSGSGDESQGLPPMRSQSALNLPPVEPWPEPVDGRILLYELRELIRRFVVLGRWAAEIVALWIVYTYAYELGRGHNVSRLSRVIARAGHNHTHHHVINVL